MAEVGVSRLLAARVTAESLRVARPDRTIADLRQPGASAPPGRLLGFLPGPRDAGWAGAVAGVRAGIGIGITCGLAVR